MSLESFAGSPLPNAIGMGSMIALTLIAYMGSRRSRGKLWLYFASLSLVFAATISAKNLAYYSIVTRAHGENNPAALDEYAATLDWIVGFQSVVALGVLVVGYSARNYAQLTTTVAVVCMHAAVCTLDWGLVYESHDTRTPVHFELANVPLHVLLLTLLFVSIIATMGSYVLRMTLR